MIGQWWSWTLAGIGVTGFWLTSRGRWRIGWSLNIAVQLLWITYAVVTRQWGFIVSACAYGYVFVRNLRREVRRSDQRHDAGGRHGDDSHADGSTGRDGGTRHVPQG